jgi:hypothetical protein
LEHPVADYEPGELIRPHHCRVSASPDKTQLALTFEIHERKPVTIVLPMAGAVGLQRKLAQSLFLLANAGRGRGDKPQPAGADASDPAH